MKNAWRYHNSRVKYVAAVGGPVAVLEVYVCLDNEFHSWAYRRESEEPWQVYTFASPCYSKFACWSIDEWLDELVLVYA